MIGGGIICASYFYGLEYGWLSSAYLADTNLTNPNGPLDAGCLGFTAESCWPGQYVNSKFSSVHVKYMPDT